MRKIFKTYLLPIYKFIIDFFNLPKTKFYRYFVKFLWRTDANDLRSGAITTMIVCQFAIWHWVFDFSIGQDIVSIFLAILVWDFINRLITNMK